MLAYNRLSAVALNPQPLPPKDLVIRWNPPIIILPVRYFVFY